MNTKGFTLMEVTLFLAISSVLSLVAFVGLGPRLRNVRFTDSMRGIESSVNRAISSSQAGENDGAQICESRGGKAQLTDPSGGSITPGTSGECVSGGIHITFKDSSIEYYQVPLLRERSGSSDCPEVISGAKDVLDCFGGTTEHNSATSPTMTYDLSNGLKRLGNSDTQIIYLANPEDNQHYLLIDGSKDVTEKKICYELNGRRASLNFSTDSIEPKIVFNDEDCS